MARIGFPTIEAKKDIRCRKTFAVLSRKYFQYELSLVITIHAYKIHINADFYWSTQRWFGSDWLKLTINVINNNYMALRRV